ncbi:MAG: allophanate hydrolase [Hyphomicrobiaceae bacterium]|nr:allophanate hydrolase [Hyphomicrobiaceae bacterium]
MAETVAALVAGHRSGAIAIADTVQRTFHRIREVADPAIFISLRKKEEVFAEARQLAHAEPSLPLYGVPFAVKDNIDVAGLPTTAGCPAFAYTPGDDAHCVARLKAAGAIVIGKTNLDQFATGLVGMRSPYGMPRNPLRADLVSGGSSSGSAVAVATGIVPLALGTDTAGSGRVPAGFNNIVGLKPSVGLISVTGVVPACRSLDCVAIFTLTVEDAFAALQVMADWDARDPYSRQIAPGVLAAPPQGLRIAVPRREDKLFFGDDSAARSFAAAEDLVQAMGARLVEIDLAPFFAAGRLLYEGPWVAERMAAVGEFIAARPEHVHPITREIILQGAAKSAVDAFRGLYKLAELRGQTQKALAGIDALMVPTMPTPSTVTDVERDPIGPNARLGTYTNFVNLLDMAGIAVPVSLTADGTPYGVTLLAFAGRDEHLSGIGAAIHARTGLPLGALGSARAPMPPLASGLRTDELAIAVVGAHMSGMMLNSELVGLGGRFLQRGRTSADYRLFALQGGTVSRPGLLRVAQGSGHAIELETWALPAEGFARFVAAVPPPLSIGSVVLGDGSMVKGFLVEAEATYGAREISSFGGWRAFLAAELPQG